MRHEMFGATIHDAVLAHKARQIAWIQQDARLVADMLSKTFERPGTERVPQVAGTTLNGFFENLDIVFGGLGGTTAARSVSQAGEALCIESMNRFEYRLDRRIPCRGDGWDTNALSRLQDHLGPPNETTILATVEYT